MIHTVKVSWAGLLATPPILDFKDAVLHRTMWKVKQNQGTTLHGSGHLLVQAVLTVGKAV